MSGGGRLYSQMGAGGCREVTTSFPFPTSMPISWSGTEWLLARRSPEMGENELEAQVFIRGGEIAHFELIYFCCYLFRD